MAYGRHAGVPNSSSNPVGGVDARPASAVGKREVEEIDWEAWPRYFLLGGQDKAILETSKKTEIMAFEQGRASTLKAAIKASPNRVITIILQLRDNPEELFAIGRLQLHNLKTVSSE
ncbi:hypothetical protein HMN09_01086600 [Mycena chlorophos]|uniref:Uncharacterized protein n=1 Tax=Mycena chlorophos TaxID=658473 RepID=A0A8H6SAW0_MYCCL|nr:hypothetical protein HMN09_01086600 [Mycena chlorophos]